ncbi:MAG: hypothetical protein C0404_00095 [Verrucomicrobia bacterium]|nr:hypothetical protein [Verrucomicrobiota bacterium]
MDEYGRVGGVHTGLETRNTRGSWLMKYCSLAFVLALCVSAVGVRASVIHVRKDASGLNTGASWTDAYTNLQSALSAAVSNDQIWVAAGVYLPGTNRTDTFQLKEWVDLYGGFNGTETDRNQRDWTNHLSVLSGDVLVNDTGFSNNIENVYRVIEATNNVTVDGFVIRGGNANGAYPYCDGGGMHSWSSSPTVQNCVFSNNYASRHGGGVSFCAAAPVTRDCVFADNASAIYGGGMDNGLSTSTVERCVFIRNSSYRGGGMYNGTTPTSSVQRCVFSGNSAYSGGGMYNNSAPIVLKNNIFSGNLATYDGGGLRNAYSAIIARDCVFVENSAAEFGGGILNNNCAPVIDNCAFSGNRTPKTGGAIYNVYSSPTISDCSFSGNYAGEAGGGVVNAMEAPIVVNSVFAGNVGKYGGGMANAESQPTIANCTFSGNTASFGGAVENQKASPVFENCILWNDNGSGSEIINTYTSAVTLLFCDIKGAWNGTGVVNQTSSTVTNGGGNINLDPMFARDTNGTWKLNATYDTNTFQSTLTDTNAAWIPGELAGRFVRPTMSNALQYLIVSNSATKLAVWGDFSTNGFNGRTYRIYDYRLKRGSPCIDKGTNVVIITDDMDGIFRPFDGDTNSVGTTDIGAYEYSTSPCPLTVFSALASVKPPPGAATYSSNSILWGIAPSPVTLGVSTQYLCLGWVGTGSVPPGGATTNTGAFSLTNASSITWSWITNYWLSADAGAGGSVNPTNSWRLADSMLAITASPAAGYTFTGWTGTGVPAGSETNNPLQFTMDRPRALTAGFIETVSVPTNISGVSTTYVGKSETYTATGAVSALAHSLQYRYDWGDGSTSAWGVASQGRTWATNGTFAVRAQARCATHTNGVSPWSYVFRSVTANFLTLTTSVLPSSEWGSISNAPNKPRYTYNESVTLTGLAATGYVFEVWSGDTNGTANPVTVVMNRDKNIQARFKTGPDFMVSGITLVPAQPLPGSNFTAYVMVTNVGATAGNGRTLYVYTNKPAEVAVGTAGNGSVLVGNLNPAQGMQFTFTGLKAGAGGGIEVFRAFVDAFGQTVEACETNNQATLAHGVPDVIITGITPSPASGIMPLTVQFVAAVSNSRGRSLTYAWTFGDGASSTVQSPGHLYTTNGTFTAALTVSDGWANTSTASVQVYVAPVPRILNWKSLKDSFEITWEGPTDKFYRIEMKTNLFDDIWALVERMGSTTINCRTVTVDNVRQQYYRVLAEP